MFLGPANTSGKVDTAFFYIVGICVVLLVAVTLCMVVFLFKYNRKRHPEHEEVKENLTLEIIWTVIPTVLVLFMFYLGWVDFSYIRNPPPDAMTVNVIARQWSWQFEYVNGKQAGVLRVPVGKDIKLILTSQDVVHSFFVPAFRVKEDCVPGMKTHLWFNARETGSYNIFCTEYCGTAHSHMLSKVIVMPVSDFKAWYSAKEVVGSVEKGHQLLQSKGCLGCHSTDGTRKVGPTLKGLFGSSVTVLTNGKERTITADGEYLKRSVLQPGADIVKGYQNIMPTIPLSEEELEEVLEYIESLK